MRKNIIRSAVILVIAGSFLVTGCTYRTGSGDIVSEKRTTAPFDGISVSGDFDVEIKKGDREEVILEADDNLIKNIETEVVHGTLRIRSTDHN